MDRAGDRVLARVELQHRDRQLAQVDDGGAGRHHAGHHGPLHHPGGTLAVAGRSDRGAFGEQGREGGAQAGAVFRRQFDVDQADQAVGGEQPPLVMPGPDDALVHR